MIYTAIAIFWVLCGILSYPISFAYWQREYALIADMDYDLDKRRSVMFGFFGPIGLAVIFCFSGFARHGLKWR